MMPSVLEVEAGGESGGRGQEVVEVTPVDSVTRYCTVLYRYAITCTLDLVHRRRSSRSWDTLLTAARY